VYTTASKSAFLTGLSVILVPVLLAVIWRRHVNRYTLMGVGAAFIGLYLLTVPPAQNGLIFSSINRGDLLTLVCAVAFALQIIYVGRSAQRYPFGQLVTLQIAFCAMWMWLSIPLAERSAHIRFTPPVVWALLICGLIGTVVAFIVQAWAQQFTPPTHTALIFSLEPVFAAGTSFVLLGERLGGRGLLGGALILGGVLLSEVLGTVQHPEAELREEAS
jgi:drug/metabolite transporter (DMT)-like permease